MISDCLLKKEEDEDKFNDLSEALERIYKGENPDTVYQDFKDLKFENGLDVEALLKVVTWLFIEQDIRYWFGDGRKMTKEAFDKLSPDEEDLEEYKSYFSSKQSTISNY